MKDYSGEGDASSIELNPALLIAAPQTDLSIRYYRAYNDFTRGSGAGVFFSLNLPLGVAMGVGLQGVWPALGHEIYDERADLNPDLAKISYALAIGDAKSAAMGIGIHGARLGGKWLRAPDLDVGTLIRITNYASLGAMARLGPTSLTGPGAETNLAAELAIRPLGTRTLELAGGVGANLPPKEWQAQTQEGVVLPRARVALRHQGITVSGEIEQVAGTQLDRLTLESQRAVKSWRGSLALGLTWDFMGVEAGAHAASADSLHGYGVAARFSSSRHGRSYWPRTVDAEMIDVRSVTNERSLITMLTRLKRAEQAGDRSVLVIDARQVSLGWSSLQELRDAFVRVRRAGGHVFAYLENASTKGYYLATAAEKVFMHPAGQLNMPGLSATTLYYKDALEKIGVRVEALRIDEYKSAHEPYTRSGRSEPDREQREALLDTIFGRMVWDIAQAREITQEEVRRYIDQSPVSPDDAREADLVDKVLFRDQLTEVVSEVIGAEVKFASFPSTAPENPTWAQHPYVAVLLVEGTITNGRSLSIPILDINMAGSETIVEALRALRGDPACEGIVLRVNSPGGSALGSDVIWREVAKTHAEHKKAPKFSPPIVVSMSDVAGSGGYYVAMGAEHVFVQETTITGSIGVVSQHFDVSGLLATLGINADSIHRGKNPGMFEPYRPYSDDARERLQASIQYTYDLFRRRVSKARGMTMEQVHKLARGHVYSGKDALALGLVDEVGGLYDAIDYLREKAGLGDWRETKIRIVPAEANVLDMILD
ncbi:MAG: signal peptide peptidase SppA, partial [Nannocystaceae bacterium]